MIVGNGKSKYACWRNSLLEWGPIRSSSHVAFVNAKLPLALIHIANKICIYGSLPLKVCIKLYKSVSNSFPNT